MPELKLVLHVNQGDRWPAALSNLRNLARDYPALPVRVVVNGTAVQTLAGGNAVREQVVGFADAGIAVQLCANALREHAVPQEALPAAFQVVPAGVVALAEAQQEGYAYVKP